MRGYVGKAPRGMPRLSSENSNLAHIVVWQKGGGGSLGNVLHQSDGRDYLLFYKLSKNVKTKT